MTEESQPVKLPKASTVSAGLLVLAVGGGVPALSSLEGRISRLETGQQQSAVTMGETRRDIAAIRDNLNGLRDDFRDFVREMRAKK